MQETQEAKSNESELEYRAMANRDSEREDDCPGDFFRLPGIPVPGQTEWSLL